MGLCLVALATSSRADGFGPVTGTFGSQKVSVEAEILDTEKSVFLGGKYYFHKRIAGVTMRLTEFGSADGQPLHPLVARFLKEGARKLRAGVGVGNHTGLEGILAKHRRAMGFGVKGPLRVKGTLDVYVLISKTDPDETGIQGVHLTPDEISGPEGSWTRKR